MNEHLKRSRKQEKRGAKILGGTVNAGSGNGPRKNDVRAGKWSVEYKTTLAGSYRLKLSELQTAQRQAILEHRHSLFGIDFAGGTGGTDRYVIIGESDLHELIFDLGELEQRETELRERILNLEATAAMQCWKCSPCMGAHYDGT